MMLRSRGGSHPSMHQARGEPSPSSPPSFPFFSSSVFSFVLADHQREREGEINKRDKREMSQGGYIQERGSFAIKPKTKSFPSYTNI